MGHGFYQFSPELFFRVFCKSNGFEVVEMLLIEHQYPSLEIGTKKRVYRVRDPKSVGKRVTLVNRKPTVLYLMQGKWRKSVDEHRKARERKRRAECDDPREGVGPSVLSESGALAQAETECQAMRHGVQSLRVLVPRGARAGTNAGRRRPWPSPNFLHPTSDGPHFGFREQWRRSGYFRHPLSKTDYVRKWQGVNTITIDKCKESTKRLLMRIPMVVQRFVRGHLENTSFAR